MLNFSDANILKHCIGCLLNCIWYMLIKLSEFLIRNVDWIHSLSDMPSLPDVPGVTMAP